MKKRIILCAIALVLCIAATFVFFTKDVVSVGYGVEQEDVEFTPVYTDDYTGYEYIYSNNLYTAVIVALIAAFALLPLIGARVRALSIVGAIGTGIIGFLTLVMGKLAADTTNFSAHGSPTTLGLIAAALFLSATVLLLIAAFSGRKVLGWSYSVFQGALIGGGAILPGISGGVLSVLFGIYRPLMELLTHPIQAIKKNYKLFIPVGIGAAIGFILFAKLVAWLFGDAEVYAVCLFVGLIIGTVPMLWKDAGKEGHTKGGIISAIVAFVALCGILLTLKVFEASEIPPNDWWYLFCGAVWGLSLIVPGMSSSSILIFVGLYEPMSKGIGDLNFRVIVPVIIGILVVAVTLARFVNMLFEKKYSIVSHAIVGLVCASTVMIIPTSFASVGQFFGCLGCAVVGFAIAFAMDIWGKKIKPQD